MSAHSIHYMFIADIEPNIFISDPNPHSLIVDWSGPVFTNNIAYDMDVTQMTLGSTQIVLFKEIHSLVNTHYNFTSLNRSVCDRFSFTVTPTEGGRRGISSQPVTGFFTQARGKGELFYLFMSPQLFVGEGGSTTVTRGEDEAVKQVTFNGIVSKSYH